MKLLTTIIILLILLVPVLVFSQQPKDCRTDGDCPQNQFCNKTIGLCQPRQDVQPTPGNYIVVPPSPVQTETLESTPTQTVDQKCKDTEIDSSHIDGWNLETSGTTTNRGVAYIDFCESQEFIKEYYCPNGIFSYGSFNCATINPNYKCIVDRCADPSTYSR